MKPEIQRQENPIRTFVNGDLKKFCIPAKDISGVYMIVFGNTPGVNEGGIHTANKNTISLNQYMNLLTSSPLFLRHKKDTRHLQDINPKDEFTTKELLLLLDWMNSLNDESQEGLLKHVEDLFGYRPYYNRRKVIERFETDLTPGEASHPILSYWGDVEYKVCGFLTGIVLDTIDEAKNILGNIQYLSSDQLEQVTGYLTGSPFPILFEAEGAVIPERTGKKRGSKWGIIKDEVRDAAWRLGAGYSFGLTFQDSIYYLSQRFLVDLPVSNEDGHDMRFVVNAL